jgi:hypothetical protein
LWINGKEDFTNSMDKSIGNYSKLSPLATVPRALWKSWTLTYKCKIKGLSPPPLPLSLSLSLCQETAKRWQTCLIFTYLLTEPAPSWGATQELPIILWNPKVHKSSLLIPILSHIKQIHTIPFWLSKIHFNIVHQHTSLSS